jgi:hypothetical protein
LNEKTQFSFKDNTFSKPVISGYTVKSWLKYRIIKTSSV